jgi:transcriptional regulator GlxA family with amidase domain
LRLLCELGPTQFDVRKYRCAVVLSRCAHGARRGGASSDVLLDLFWRRFTELTRLRTWQAVRKHMHRFVDELLGLTRPAEKTKIEGIVAWIREDLEETLDSPNTLSRYAEAAGLSRAHLSRTFSAVAGRTFRDEMLRARIDAARKLLTQTSLKVGIIARRLGVRDTSHFIATFRKATGLTPVKYRRRLSAGTRDPRA